MEIEGRDEDTLRRVAQAVIEGQIAVVVAVRAMLPILHQFPAVVSIEDYNLIRGIDSETDSLPIGPVQELWDRAVVLEKRGEIAHCEVLWGDQLRGACERILEKMKRKP